MKPDPSLLSRTILDLYTEGYSPSEIGQMVALAESRVLFTLDQLDALTLEHSRMLAERMEFGRLSSRSRERNNAFQQEIEPKENATMTRQVSPLEEPEDIRQSEENIQAEMMATQLSLVEQFGMESMARGSVGNATRMVRAALSHGLVMDDALKFGRAVMLNTVKLERPGLLSPEEAESIGRAIQELSERYGEDTVGIVIDEVQVWAQANE